MRRGALLATFVVCLALLSASFFVVAGESPEQLEYANPSPATVVARLQAALDAEEGELERLYARAEAASDADEALAIQREIEATKRATMVTMLRINSEQARQAGDEASAESFEAAAKRLESAGKPRANSAIQPEVDHRAPR